MGLAAIVHHGLIGGLTQVVAGDARRISVPAWPPVSADEAPLALSPDPALVRLLANMVLRIHTEVRHVY